MQKIKITKITQTDKDKEGNQLTNKFGPYFRIGLQTEQHGTKWLSGFSKSKLDWQVGQEVDIEVTENGQYLNFSIPKKNDLLEDRVSNIEKTLSDFKKEMETKFVQLKADLVLETTGKFQTTKDYNKMNEDYGTIPEPDF